MFVEHLLSWMVSLKVFEQWYNKQISTKEGKPQGFWSKVNSTEKRNRQVQDAVKP